MSSLNFTELFCVWTSLIPSSYYVWAKKKKVRQSLDYFLPSGGGFFLLSDTLESFRLYFNWFDNCYIWTKMKSLACYLQVFELMKTHMLNHKISCSNISDECFIFWKCLQELQGIFFRLKSPLGFIISILYHYICIPV